MSHFSVVFSVAIICLDSTTLKLQISLLELSRGASHGDGEMGIHGDGENSDEHCGD